MTSLCGFNPSTPPIPVGQKAVADGVATLDGSGKIPIEQIPDSVANALKFQGTWNADTNTPTLTSSVGNQGDAYIVSDAGTTNLDGITDWQVNDWAVFNGTVWEKIDNSDLVVSVNGQVGIVVLDTDDIAEGITNLYNQTHTGDVTGSISLTIADNSVTNAKAANMAANSLKGNNTGGAADPVDLTTTQARTLLNVEDGSQANTVDSVNTQTGAVVLDTDDISQGATNLYNQTHTGDVTGAIALTIANNSVTNAKAADMATMTIKGNNTGGSADPIDLTASQAKTLLGTTFLELTDTPASYGSEAALPVKVNTAKDGLEVSDTISVQRIDATVSDDLEVFSQGGTKALEVRSLDGNVGIGTLGASDQTLFVEGDALVRLNTALQALTINTISQATVAPRLAFGSQLAGTFEAFIERDNDGADTTTLLMRTSAGITFEVDVAASPFTFDNGPVVVNDEMVTAQRWVFEKYFAYNNIPANATTDLSFNNIAQHTRAFTTDKKGNVNRIHIVMEPDASYTAWTTGTAQFVFLLDGVAQHTTTAFTKAAFNGIATGILNKTVKQVGLDIDFAAGDEVSCQVITSATYNGTGIEMHMNLFGFYDNT